ncbi:low choriolytic enzyme-like [Uloborus diversus]|uniref:low choriolytic enzyme-like n=1 Tax=Uloborus diversus TaxID=327109 RepID=UPI00240A80AC|nr:low choriolytic enzyme-like [Uloborus diversus]
MVHAVGFYHEQNRSDRDDYVTIHWDNIIVGMEPQFEKRKPEENQLLTPYDYESIMHYDSLVFSYDKLRDRKTITPKQKGVVLKTTREKLLSPTDILKINKLYKC